MVTDRQTYIHTDRQTDIVLHSIIAIFNSLFTHFYFILESRLSPGGGQGGSPRPRATTWQARERRSATTVEELSTSEPSSAGWKVRSLDLDSSIIL